MAKRGRKPWEPNEEERKLVIRAARIGLPREKIARILGIAEETLVKAMSDVLDTESDKAIVEVGATLFDMATSGTQPAMTAFFMKCRAGWREKDDRPEGGSESRVNVVLEVMPKPSRG